MKILDSVFSMLRSGGQVLAIRLVSILLQFGFVWYISNFLGDNVYGDFVIYLMIIQFFGTVGNLGLDILIVKRIGSIHPIDHQYNSTFLRKVTAAGVSVSMLLTLLAVTLLNRFVPGYLPESLSVWTYLVGATFNGLSRLLAEYYRAIRWITISTIFSFVVAPSLAILILWLIKAPHGELYPLVVTWIIAMSFVIVFSLLIKWFYQWKSVDTVQKVDAIGSLVKVSFPFLVTLVLVLLNGWIDKMVLRLYIESDLLGQYHVAYRLSAMVFLPLMAFNTLLAPMISKAFHDGESTEKLRSIIWNVLRWAMLFSVIAFVGFILIGKFILGIFNEGYVLMYPVLLILSVGQLVNVAAGPVGVVMKMTQLQTLYAKIMAASLVINLILNLILVPSWGVYGAAIGSTVGLIVVNLGAWYMCRQRLGLSTGIV